MAANGGTQILVASGDEDIRVYLEVTLELVGWEVHPVAGARELLQAASREAPSVIIMDVALPQVSDGWEALQVLRSRADTQPVYIVVLSGVKDREVVIDSLDHGADDFVPMPFDSEELLARLRAGLRRSRTGAPTSEASGSSASVSLGRPRWDYFRSHAGPDKAEFVRPLADELAERGVRVWYDDFEIELGDSIRERIEEGLRESELGLVVLSPRFLDRGGWTDRELDGLTSVEKRIIPLFYDLRPEDLAASLPALAGRKGIVASTQDLGSTVDSLVSFLRVRRRVRKGL